MKSKFIALTLVAFGLTMVSCGEDYLNQPPQGAYSGPSLANGAGAEGLLLATYANLDGLWFESWGNNHFNQVGGAANWAWGGVRSDDSYKGTEVTDFVNLNPVERYETQPSNGSLTNKWNGSYDGVGRANEAIRTIQGAEDIAENDKTALISELRFLRAHFHFEAVKNFNKAPYVDETVSDFASVTNSAPIWPQLEADFKAAFDNLPGTMPSEGRANKWAAGAYLAKTYMYQGKWADAKSMYDQILANGTTSAGIPYALEPIYHDNFKSSEEPGNTESIFAYEASNAGDIVNGNYENTLNQPHGSGTPGAGCCGFYQPSQNLLNAFKTDASGLPMPATYNNEDFPDDEGFPSTGPWSADGEFMADQLVSVSSPDNPNQERIYKALSDNTGQNPISSSSWELVWEENMDIPLDPRAHWTIGTRAKPYLDWGNHPGNNWIRDVNYAGPFSPLKNVPLASDFQNNLAGVYDWGFTLTAQNVHIIRFADVILMAAEAEAELGNLSRATELVNMIRERAANEAGWVKNADGTNAHNYQISTYPTFGSQAAALTAIRFERRLEFGMEGHRMYDLVRWDNLSESGATALPLDIAQVLNSYLAGEDDRRYLDNASFAERHKYLPIPESVISQSTVDGVQNIVQNDGF